MADNSRELEFILKMRDEASRILKQNGQEWGRTGDSAKKAKASFDEVARAVGAATAAIVAMSAATGTFNNTAGAFGRLERSMIGVQKTTNFTAQEMAKFKAEFIGLAAASSVPIQQMGEIATVAGQLGIKGTAGVLAFTDTVSKLGTATDLAGEEAASSLARMMNIFNEAPATVGRLGDALVNLGNNSAATEAEIARIATEVSLSTATFNIGTQAASAIGAAMAELGIRAELGGTSVGRVFNTIASAAQEGGYQLTVLADLTGKTRDEFAALAKDNPRAAFDAFITGLGQSIRSGGDYLGVLGALDLQQLEINKTIVPLAQNYDKLAQNYDIAANSAGALNKEYNAAAQGQEALISQLSNNLEILGGSIGGAVSEETKAAIRAATDLIAGLNEGFQALNPSVQKVVAGVLILTPTLAAAAVAVTATAAALKVLGVGAAVTAVQTAGLVGVLKGLAVAARFAVPVLALGAGFMAYGAGASLAADETANLEAASTRLKAALDGLNVAQQDTVTEARAAAKAHEDATRAALERVIAEGQMLAQQVSNSWNPYEIATKSLEALGKADLAEDLLKQLDEAKKQRLDIEYRIYEDSKNAAILEKGMKDKQKIADANPIAVPVTFLTADEAKAVSDLVNTIAPAIQKQFEYEQSMKLLEKAAKLSDEALQSLGLTQEKLAAITEQAKNSNLSAVSSINESIRKSEEQIALLKVESSERELATSIMELEAQARRDGITLLGEEAMARLELAKAKLKEADSARRQDQFDTNIKDQIRDLEVQAFVANKSAGDREKASALAKLALDAERQGITLTAEAVAQYAAAWDRANSAEQQASFRDSNEDALKDLMTEVELLDRTGKAYDRQSQLVQIAMDAQKAGIQDVTPVLQQYIDLWKKLDDAQQGTAGAMLGVRTAFQDFIDETKDTKSQFEQLTTEMLDGFSDNLVDTLWEGEANWADFFGNIGKMATKMAIKNIMGGLFDKAGMGTNQNVSASEAAATASKVGTFTLGSSAANPMWVKSADGGMGGLLPEQSQPQQYTVTPDNVTLQVDKQMLPNNLMQGENLRGGLDIEGSSQRMIDAQNNLSKTMGDLRGSLDAAGRSTAPLNQPMPNKPMQGPQQMADPASFSKMITLTPKEVIDLKKTVATEWVQSAGDTQAKGIVDTILNRKASGKWGDSITSVVNARNQFSDINGPPARSKGRNNVDQLPMSRIDGRTDQLVEQYLAERMAGAQSSVGDNLNYANPNYSDAKNLGWINALEGPTFGRGDAIHKHGTTPDLQKYRPGNYGIQMSGQEGMQMPEVDTTTITNSIKQTETQLNQMGTSLTTVGQQAQMVATQQQNLGTATMTTGNAAQTAASGMMPLGTSVQSTAQQAQTAAQNFQNAGVQIGQAGQQAQQAGTAIPQATAGLDGFGTGLQGLLGPLTQAIPGLGQFGGAIMGLVQNLLSGIGGGGGGGAGGGLGGIVSGIFGLFHEGGKVGPGMATTRVDFSRLPKHHEGTSLKGDEYMAVLQRNERVLTADQERRTMSTMEGLAERLSAAENAASQVRPASAGGGQTINMTVNTKDANSFRKSQGQMMAEAGLEMNRMSTRNN